MEYRTLGRTGLKVSIVGYGASPLGNEFGPTDVQEGVRAVHCAIDKGINFFDVSPYYGRTLAEERLGAALEGKRHKVFLTTKCGRYDVEAFDFSARRVTASIEESLIRLRTDYVDLLQAHDIEFGDRRQIIEETLPAMRKLQQAGKCRWVGITGYPVKMLADVAERGGADTVLSYCHYNLMITDMDEHLTPICQKRRIGLINASPLHMRILAERGAPDWHPAPEPVKQAGQKVAELCRAAGADISDLALRFCLDHPYVATTLVGMSKQRHVETNVLAASAKIDPALMQRIRETIAPVFNAVWPSGRPENYD
jgi:L-galactose dehydrogenase